MAVGGRRKGVMQPALAKSLTMSQDTQIPVSQPWTFKSDLVEMIPGYFLCFKFPKLLFCAFRYRNDWKSPPSVCQSDGTGDSPGLGRTLKENRCCFLSPEISVRTWANAEKVQACWGPQVRTHTERKESTQGEPSKGLHSLQSASHASKAT